MDDLTPEQTRDLADRLRALRMRQTAGMLELGAVMLTASIAARNFARACREAEAAEFDEARTHPDMLELDVAAASWYPEADRG